MFWWTADRPATPAKAYEMAKRAPIDHAVWKHWLQLALLRNAKPQQ
jgi:hypothetical protein